MTDRLDELFWHDRGVDALSKFNAIRAGRAPSAKKYELIVREYDKLLKSYEALLNQAAELQTYIDDLQREE